MPTGIKGGSLELSKQKMIISGGHARQIARWWVFAKYFAIERNLRETEMMEEM
jgi:hypothetical protein